MICSSTFYLCFLFFSFQNLFPPSESTEPPSPSSIPMFIFVLVSFSSYLPSLPVSPSIVMAFCFFFSLIALFLFLYRMVWFSSSILRSLGYLFRSRSRSSLGTGWVRYGTVEFGFAFFFVETFSVVVIRRTKRTAFLIISPTSVYVQMSIGKRQKVILGKEKI